MKIALVGTRGIPANYGGFETFAEELSTRLAARGHDVRVYCRTNNVETRAQSYRGVRLVHLPTIPHKYFDTLAHTGFATLHLLFRRADVALYCNGANAIFTWIPRVAGIPTALNVDGLERQRKKWNALARGWYRLSESWSTWMPAAMISDARVIERYYLDAYGKRSHCIAYGADLRAVGSRTALDTLGLEPGGYFLYVSRMEPENNALLVVKAFEKVTTDKRLVMVGDAPYAADYIRGVKATADPRILFPGAIYGQGYAELQSHCFAYIHATEVGGTHPALIEAMGRGAPVLYLRTPENEEVAAEAGIGYEKDEGDLAAVLERVCAMSETERRARGERARAEAGARYDWERVADQYESLFRSLLAPQGSPEIV
jgi:glycosyltransferase involved in cell wall biosynthesis